MKIFTKSVFAVLALMAGVTTANAQEEWMDPDKWVELTADDWHQWANPDDETRCTKSAQIVGTATPAWNIGSEVGQGAPVLGAENVEFNKYADISDYDKLILLGSGSNTWGCRLMCNREINEGAWKNYFIEAWASDPHWVADLEALVFDLSEVKNMTLTANGEGDSEGKKTGDERVDDYVHLHCLKTYWGDIHITLDGIFVWKADDPTGIKNVKANVEDGAYYNLAGQKVANPEKGVFIHNGKKIVKK